MGRRISIAWGKFSRLFGWTHPFFLANIQIVTSNIPCSTNPIVSNQSWHFRYAIFIKLLICQIIRWVLNFMHHALNIDFEFLEVISWHFQQRKCFKRSAFRLRESGHDVCIMKVSETHKFHAKIKTTCESTRVERSSIGRRTCDSKFPWNTTLAVHVTISKFLSC